MSLLDVENMDSAMMDTEVMAEVDDLRARVDELIDHVVDMSNTIKELRSMVGMPWTEVVAEKHKTATGISHMMDSYKYAMQSDNVKLQKITIEKMCDSLGLDKHKFIKGVKA